MFNLKRTLEKVFGHKAIKPRKAAVISTAPSAAPQVALDDARRSFLNCLKAVEEKKRVEEKERRKAFQNFIEFLRDAYLNDGFEADDCERVCSALGISIEVIDTYFTCGELPAFSAALEYFISCGDDFGTAFVRASRSIAKGLYKFYEDVHDDETLGETIAQGHIDAVFWDYVDFEAIAYDYKLDGEYGFYGFFKPL